jgi:2-iminobutanoate/2-iminopropanoate deaminase
MLYCSGQTPLDPATGELVGDDVATQARQALANLSAVLEAAGGTLDSIVKTTVFLTDMADFAEMNAVYAEHFAEPYPARSTVAVRALPKACRVEIEAVASLG